MKKIYKKNRERDNEWTHPTHWSASSCSSLCLVSRSISLRAAKMNPNTLVLNICADGHARHQVIFINIRGLLYLFAPDAMDSAKQFIKNVKAIVPDLDIEEPKLLGLLGHECGAVSLMGVKIPLNSDLDVGPKS